MVVEAREDDVDGVPHEHDRARARTPADGAAGRAPERSNTRGARAAGRREGAVGKVRGQHLGEEARARRRAGRRGERGEVAARDGAAVAHVGLGREAVRAREARDERVREDRARLVEGADDLHARAGAAGGRGGRRRRREEVARDVGRDVGLDLVPPGRRGGAGRRRRGALRRAQQRVGDVLGPRAQVRHVALRRRRRAGGRVGATPVPVLPVLPVQLPQLVALVAPRQRQQEDQRTRAAPHDDEPTIVEHQPPLTAA